MAKQADLQPVESVAGKLQSNRTALKHCIIITTIITISINYFIANNDNINKKPEMTAAIRKQKYIRHNYYRSTQRLAYIWMDISQTFLTLSGTEILYHIANDHRIT